MKIVKLTACLIAGMMIVLTGCESEPLPVPEAPNLGDEEVVTTEPVSGLEDATGTEDDSTVQEENNEDAAVSSTASVSFPDRVTFSLKAPLDTEPGELMLKYGTNKHALVSESHSIEVDFETITENNATYLTASWNWEMKKAGSIPPGATIWWEWVVTNTDTGGKLTIPRDSIVYTDTRFDWEVTDIDGMDIYTNSDDTSLRDALFRKLEDHLNRIELDITFPEDRKIKVFIYNNTDDLKGALIHEESWIGAVAFPGYNTILTQVNKDNLEWAQEALPHEITHLLTNEAVFGPFGDMPTWLSEGLSVYGQGGISAYWASVLTDAWQEDRLLSLNSLSGSFPADPGQAALAYAESGHFLTWLIDTNGWEPIRELLDILKDGSTINQALTDVYGSNLDQLQAEWLIFLDSDLN